MGMHPTGASQSAWHAEHVPLRPSRLRSVLEIWGAEYQENDCLLIKPEARPLLESICQRERCIMTVRPGVLVGFRLLCSDSCGGALGTDGSHSAACTRALCCDHTAAACSPPPTLAAALPRPSSAQVIGAIDGSGRVVLKDREAPEGSPIPVDLDLEKVLGDMPNKTFKCVRGVGLRRRQASNRLVYRFGHNRGAGLPIQRHAAAAPAAMSLTAPTPLCDFLRRFDRKAEPTSDLSLPAGTSAAEALDRVLRLPSVCSKRFLTTKVGVGAPQEVGVCERGQRRVVDRTRCQLVDMQTLFKHALQRSAGALPCLAHWRPGPAVLLGFTPTSSPFLTHHPRTHLLAG